MQELQPVPGLAGRPLGGGGGPAANGLLRRHGGSSSAAEVRCPRCDSPDTKFCYYNNYNLAQPRHFCRACRRYWTKGGHLRNVPVCGGCRKHKPRRPAPASAAADCPGFSAVHRDGKAPRSGFDAGAPVSAAFSDVLTEPSGAGGGGGGVAEASAGGTGSFAAGDTRALLVPRPPAPLLADQASVLASLLAPPRPLPALGSSARPQAEERVAARLLAAEQPPPPPCTAAATDTAPSAAGSDGALEAGVSDWPTAASFAGMLELSGRIAGDAASLLPEYWSSGNWPEYLP